MPKSVPASIWATLVMVVLDTMPFPCTLKLLSIIVPTEVAGDGQNSLLLVEAVEFSAKEIVGSGTVGTDGSDTDSGALGTDGSDEVESVGAGVVEDVGAGVVEDVGAGVVVVVPILQPWIVKSPNTGDTVAGMVSATLFPCAVAFVTAATAFSPALSSASARSHSAPCPHFTSSSKLAR